MGGVALRRPRATRPLAERLWPKVDKRGPGECWPWVGSLDSSGYGQMWDGQRPTRSSRLVYALIHGPIPDGLCVLHRCDNPPCCNPAHLFLGTKGDNTADMMAKGRRGGPVKLSAEQVREIRVRVAAGERQWRVAKEYGVRDSTVCRIARGTRRQDVV